ncbi:MAG TPA: ABC transporter permease [Gammaproteobacteria bacterium]
MESLLLELRHAIRRLFRSPGFTIVVVLTLALGIGAVTAIFSVVNGVLLRPLPYPEAAQVMQLHERDQDGDAMRWAAPNFIDVREQSRSFSALAAYTSYYMTVIGNGDAVRAEGAHVSNDFFAVLGVHPVVGRDFLSTEMRNAEHVVVISHGLWQREFAGKESAIGETLTIDNEPHTIVGVMPAGMEFPAAAEYWIPYQPSATASRTAHNWDVIGRLADGVSEIQAQQELNALASRLQERYRDDTDMTDASLMSLREAIVGDVKPTLLILLGAAMCLLLIACANVTNLLLARATSRERELAIRLALGAGRRQLAGQFLVESLLLAASGGVLGVLCAAWIVQALIGIAPEHLPRLAESGVNETVLVFALSISMAAAIGIGLFTAWRATGAGLQNSLADNQRSRTGGTGSRRVRGILVVAQIALTLVLLTGAGLLGRSFMQLLDVDPGYRTSDAVVMEVLLPRPENPDARNRLAAFYRNLLDRLESIPGVESAGGINAFPLSGYGAGGTFIVLSQPDEVATFADWERIADNPSRTGHAQYRVASRDYFDTMEIPLVRGRLFNEGDTPNASHVAVISESLANRQWPNENPIGKLIHFANMDGDLAHPFTVAGVVADVRDTSLGDKPQSLLYACTCQRSAALGGRFTVAIHGQLADSTIISMARQVVRDLDPGVPVRFRTLEDVFSVSLSDKRFSMTLLGVFGIAALLLAAMGIYGVIAYLVAQQTREFGIRMALGAQAGTVLRLVLRRGAMLALAGLSAGLVISLAATRVLSSLLFDVSATDPVVFAGVVLLLASVALIACYIPAHRATKVDPMTALREE